jgi:probable selenium-dependent hydroxylase accessory protein YqeC
MGMPSLKQAFKLEEGGVVALVGAGGKTSLLFRLAHELSRGGNTVLTTTTTKIMMPRKVQSEHVIEGLSAASIVSQAKDRLADHPHITGVSGSLSWEGKLAGLEPDVVDQIWESGTFQWILVEADGAAGRPLKAPATHEPVIPGSCTHAIGVVGLSVLGKPLNESWVFRTEAFTELIGRPQGQIISEEAVADLIVHPLGLMKGIPKESTGYVFLNQADYSEKVKSGQRIGKMLKERKFRGAGAVLIGRAQGEPTVVECIDLRT